MRWIAILLLSLSGCANASVKLSAEAKAPDYLPSFAATLELKRCR